ncbi:MAG TPA: PQQ-binding-like beta-propeller repeat protein [Candidatus Limnocylindrales bacterium]|nr:PQQ-binding-like beta-propeller repeat protein [Candidatus Limnocylindrales bacterium]
MSNPQLSTLCSGRFRIGQLLMAVAFFGALRCEADLVGDWSTYGGGPTHSGYFPGSLNGSSLVLKWTAPMPNFNILQPVTGGGRVFVSVGWYFGAMSLRALDANTGQSLWSNELGSAQAINPPTYDNGAVFVEMISPSATYRFDAATGTKNWSMGFTSQATSYMAPIAVDGTVYAATGYYTELTAYNQANGSQQFSVGLIGNGCDAWTPAFYNGKIYTWVNGLFTEHDPFAGSRNWTLTNATSSEFLYSMNRTIAIADGRAYFTSTTHLMAVDLAQKTNLWQVQGSFSGTPAVANGKVYAICDGLVRAYTTDGGYVNTYSGTNGSSFSGQLIVTDDVLFAAGDYGVYVFKLADAKVQQYITSFRTPCYCYRSSTISLANNTLYIASGDSNVYAYSAESPLQLTLDTSGSGNQINLRWASEAGRTYYVLFSTNLYTSAFARISTNVATPPINVLSIPRGNSSEGFYRLQAQ